MNERLRAALMAAKGLDPEALEALAAELHAQGFPRNGGGTASKDLKVAKAVREETHKDMVAQARQYLRDGAKTIFERYPHIKSFSWRQYSPYFIDGDACTFEAYTRYALINDEDRSFRADDDSEEHRALQDIIAFLSVLDDRTYLQLFGDHRTVKITPTGIFNVYYDHE